MEQQLPQILIQVLFKQEVRRRLLNNLLTFNYHIWRVTDF